MRNLRASLLVLLSLASSIDADIQLEDVLKRLEDMELRELKMRETMLLQDQRIGQLEDRVAKKDKEIEDLHHRIDTLQDELCDCNDRLPLAAQPSKANDGPQEKVSDSQLAGTENKPNHDELEAEDISKGNNGSDEKRLLPDPGVPVAFHAVIATNGEITHLKIGQVIIFDTERLNIGAGYHNQHGLFIAPVRGIYVFSVTILSSSGGHPRIEVDLMKNDIVLVSAFAHGSIDHDQGSVTVPVELDAGDEVWVQLEYPDDTSIWGNGYTSFSGFLLTTA